MSVYKEMYYKLFNTMTKAAEMFEEVQKETEEMYISTEENDEDREKD